MIFNKEIDISESLIIEFPGFFYFDLDSIELDNSHYGWRKSWDRASDRDRRVVLSLPNFDNDIFKEITGIDVYKELNLKEKE